MKPQISEFTYGYTLVEELSRNYNFSAVPTFPTLVEEGRAGGGYDVRLEMTGRPFFLQFKRSDFLKRSNAKYYKYFQTPYYRFSLHALKHSMQHNLLLKLESEGHSVFYVAPKFSTTRMLQHRYFNSQVAESSIWIAPNEIGTLPDRNEHSICFNKHESLVYFCSKPRPISHKLSFQEGGFKEYILSTQKENPNTEYGESHWESLYLQMDKIFMLKDPTGYRYLSGFLDNEKSYISKLAKLSRVVFGAEMLVYKNY